MNENFNIRRFGKYFSSELKGMTRQHGLTLLLFSLAPLYLFLFNTIASMSLKIDSWKLHSSIVGDLTAFFTSTVFFLIFPILCYGKVTDRKKGAIYLMTPASGTEKFISMLLITLIIAPLSFIVIYLSADFLLVTAFPGHFDYGEMSSMAEWIFAGSNKAFAYNEEYRVISMATLSTSFLPWATISAGLAGGLLFKKGKVTKTMLSCLILLIIFFGLLVKVVEAADHTSEGVRVINILWYGTQSAVAVCFLAFAYYRNRKIEL